MGCYGEVPPEREGAGLGQWLDRQKQKHREGKLSEKACRSLLLLGVSFEGHEPAVTSPGAAAAAAARGYVAAAKKKAERCKSNRCDPC